MPYNSPVHSGSGSLVPSHAEPLSEIAGGVDSCFVSKGDVSGALVISACVNELNMVDMSAGVLIAWALSPSLHLTRYLPALCQTNLKPSFLAVSFRER